MALWPSHDFHETPKTTLTFGPPGRANHWGCTGVEVDWLVLSRTVAASRQVAMRWRSGREIQFPIVRRCGDGGDFASVPREPRPFYDFAVEKSRVRIHQQASPFGPVRPQDGKLPPALSFKGLACAGPQLGTPLRCPAGS